MSVKSYLSRADVLNNEAFSTSMMEEQPADKTTSLCSVVDIWNEASEATDANLFQHHHLMTQMYSDLDVLTVSRLCNLGGIC